MEKIDGIFKPQGEQIRASTSFWPELLQKLGLQERELYQMDPRQLLQDLKSRNLARYSNPLQVRFAVIISVLEMELEGKADIKLRVPGNSLLAAELLSRAEQVARDQGKNQLAAAIASATEGIQLKQIEKKYTQQLNRLLGEITTNKSELRLITDLLQKRGFLGLYRYLQGADLGRLNDTSAVRFLALRNLLGLVLEGDMEKFSSLSSPRERKLQLDLPEIYNQMLLTTSRQRLPDLLPYLEELAVISRKDLAGAAREELVSFNREQRLPPGIVDFIVGRFHRLVFLQETGDYGQNPPPSKEELVAAAGILRNYYPAMYRYHRQLGLPEAPQEDKPVLPKFGPCFVAGAVLNLPEDEDSLIFLRFWRDCSLVRTPIGRRIISFYNRIGPGLAYLLSRLPYLRPPLRWLILLIARRIFSRMKKKKNQKIEGGFPC